MMTTRIFLFSLSLATLVVAQPVPLPAANTAEANQTFIPAVQLRAMLEAELLPRLNKGGGELELTLARELPLIPQPTDKAAHVQIIYHPTPLTPYFRVRFVIVARGQKPEAAVEWTAYYTAKLYRQVWVLRSAGKRGDSLDRVDMEQERRDVLSNNTPLWLGEKPDTKFCLNQPLGTGALLAERHVKATPVILRGQIVHAEVQVRALMVRVKAEALEDAAPGEPVRLRNIQTQREIRGIVVNEHIVKIKL